MESYRQSKLANVLFTYALCDKLSDKRICINTLHPGVVKTPIGNKADKRLHRWVWTFFSKIGGISPEKSSETYVKLVIGEKCTAKYFHSGKIKESSPLSYDKDLQEKLWKWSEKVSGISL